MSCELCIYCGNFAYKTDTSGSPICLNFAHTGNCKIPEPGRIFGISRNAVCPCGSGKKYKHCCLLK